MGTVNTSDLLAMVGGGTRALGAYNASTAQRSSLDYQSSVAANNAIIAQDKSSIAQENGQIAVGNQELKAAQLKSTQVANLAANGVDINEGGAKDVLQSTTMMAQRDTDQIQTNALREAWGYTTQAADDTSNAKALSSMASSVSPVNAAMTSMLGTATQVSPAMVSLAASKNGKQTLGP